MSAQLNFESVVELSSNVQPVTVASYEPLRNISTQIRVYDIPEDLLARYRYLLVLGGSYGHAGLHATASINRFNSAAWTLHAASMNWFVPELWNQKSLMWTTVPRVDEIARARPITLIDTEAYTSASSSIMVGLESALRRPTPQLVRITETPRTDRGQGTSLAKSAARLVAALRDLPEPDIYSTEDEGIVVDYTWPDARICCVLRASYAHVMSYVEGSFSETTLESDKFSEIEAHTLIRAAAQRAGHAK